MIRASLGTFLATLVAILTRRPRRPVGEAPAIAPAPLQAAYLAAVDAMPEDTRTIFLLHRADGLDIATVAVRTGLSSAEVEAHLAKALLALITALEAEPR
jgi:RNA polymerase sigma-70 factor (ECF subfamily)